MAKGHVIQKASHQFTWALCSVTASNAAFRKQSLHCARDPALRAGPRSGSARPAQAPVVAAVGPLCGALWEPRERALGSWRGRCRGLSMVPPARGLERPKRRAGGARGALGAGRPLAPLLHPPPPPPPPPGRGALGLCRRHGRRRVGTATPAAAGVFPASAAVAAAPRAVGGLLGPGRLPALLPLHG